MPDLTEAARALAGEVLTVGVEEEFLLLDPETAGNVPVAAKVIDALPPEAREQSRWEFRHTMLEMVTPVCATLDEVAGQLSRLRSAAAEAASAAGASLVAAGATPVAEGELTITDNPRFHAIDAHYGPIVRDPAVCGCHVHVGVGDRELAVRVGNYLRPWLPVVQALSVNSPYSLGADTGHASWRSMQLERWPSLGPTPFLASARDFDETIDLLVSAGVMLDERLVLWYSRPSSTYPTVEVRVADVCAEVGDTVLLTGVVRGLVATAIGDIAAGRPAPRVSDDLLRAAHWNAAHQGLDGTLIDLAARRSRPAWEMVDRLLAAIGPALARYGDDRTVADQLDRLRRRGTGARRQREVFAATGDLRAVVTDLARRTAGG